ncbi:hypothetical protein EST62_00480 [Chlorobaculum sp. 24CR]|uniref:hypothetical protein n=1 Tax=Chlorobaculum sp. 24CR TaxID=2508878 RepID=UPI00100A95A3|nr:hypothetical protein [Chlorobaculum sp. 24CR]RXK89052.1 hypothetical protein EST62_00480 [Chlorobaculum sp. 24CR]
MGEATKLTEAIRMIWRDAALVMVKMMREEVAETGSKGVEEWADEVEAFATGLIPPFDGKAIREGTGWTDEKVLGVLIDSGRVRTSLLQGMAAKYPGARDALTMPGKRTIWKDEFIEEQERNDKRPGFPVAPDYRAFQAYTLLMSITGEESRQQSRPKMDEYQEWGIEERTAIELALSEYEARLKDLSPDPRQRFIDRLCHKIEGAEGDAGKLRIVANMQKQIPALFEPASSAFMAIWERFFRPIEALPEAEYLKLTFEAYAERKKAYVAGLGEDDRQLLETEPAERSRKSWENLTGYLDDHKLYMYLPILIEAVSGRFERTGDGGDVLRRLEALQAKEQAADGAPDRQFIGWSGTPGQLERLADELQKEKFVASTEAFTVQFMDTGATVEEPCKWLNTDRSLGYLIDRLIHKEAIPKETNTTKTAIKHFLRKDGSKISDSLDQNRSNQKNQAKKQGLRYYR